MSKPKAAPQKLTAMQELHAILKTKNAKEALEALFQSKVDAMLADADLVIDVGTEEVEVFQPAPPEML